MSLEKPSSNGTRRREKPSHPASPLTIVDVERNESEEELVPKVRKRPSSSSHSSFGGGGLMLTYVNFGGLILMALFLGIYIFTTRDLTHHEKLVHPPPQAGGAPISISPIVAKTTEVPFNIVPDEPNGTLMTLQLKSVPFSFDSFKDYSVCCFNNRNGVFICRSGASERFGIELYLAKSNSQFAAAIIDIKHADMVGSVCLLTINST